MAEITIISGSHTPERYDFIASLAKLERFTIYDYEDFVEDGATHIKNDDFEYMIGHGLAENLADELSAQLKWSMIHGSTMYTQMGGLKTMASAFRVAQEHQGGILDGLAFVYPEIHLPAPYQGFMGDLIAKVAVNLRDDFHILVETHSPHILNGLRLAVKNGIIQPHAIHFRHHYYTGQEYDSSKPHIKRDGSMSSWPPNFFDQWDKDVMELI